MGFKLPKAGNNVKTVRLLIVNFCGNLLSNGIAIVGTPLLFCIWGPCCIYRRVVTVIAKLVRRDLGPLLGTFSTLFTDENFFKNSPNCSVVAVLKIDGNLTLSQVKQLFDDNVIRATRKSKPNERRYPELQQYPVNFLGYQFWKHDTNFCLENHIREHEPEVSMMTISKIHQHMLNEKFAIRQSPWQVKIFRNDENTLTCLALRFQHCMLDGKSILKLIVECLGNKTLNAKEVTFRERTVKEKINYWVSLPKCLYQLNTKLLQSLFHIQGHPWRRREKDNLPLNVAISGKIFLPKVKDVGRVVGVQTSAVILSVITSAAEKFLRAKYNHQSKSLSLYLMLPKRGHPETLANHMNFGYLQVPKVDDHIQRLRKCGSIYHELRVGDHARHTACTSNITTTIPAPFRSVMTSWRYATTGLSNIAGEQQGFLVGGYPCVGFNLSTGLLRSSIGVNFLVLSYKDNIQVSVVATSSVLTERDTANLARLIEKEFAGLSQLILG